MHVLEFCFYGSGVIYAFLYEPKLIYIFVTLLVIYDFFRYIYYPGNNGSIRKRLQLALWSDPKEGLIYNSVDVDLTNANEYLRTQQAKDNKVSITHLVIKALAQGLWTGKDSLNGKLVFGKYIPAKNVNISCLVDVGGGKDLAALVVEKCEEKSIEDIAKFITDRASKVKKEEDKEHKKRVGPFKLLPPLLITFMLEVASFIAYNLGITIPPVAIKADGFGCATVTSLGSLGFTNVFAPLTPMMRNSIIMAINKTVDTPVVKNGQIVIAPICKINSTIDHRFLDGAKAKAIQEAILEVLLNPQKFSKA